MQVTLNVDAKDMDGTVLQLFRELTEEQRQELAKDLLKSWLLDRLKASHSLYGADPGMVVRDAVRVIAEDMKVRMIALGTEDVELVARGVEIFSTGGTRKLGSRRQRECAIQSLCPMPPAGKK